MPSHYNENRNGNGNRNYTIAGSNQKYTGLVVKIGGKLYTTHGGAYEAFSQEVHLVEPSSTASTTNSRNGQNKQTGMRQNSSNNTPPNNNPVVATFVRGDGSQYDRTYYLPMNYNGKYGNAGGPVSNQTPLHRHKNRQTMLEHNMDNPTIVTTSRPRIVSTPTRQSRSNSGAGSRRAMQTTRNNMNSRRTTTATRRNGGGGGRTSGY